MLESHMSQSLHSTSDFSFLRAAAAASCHNSTGSLQMLALQEELSDAKERIIQLTARLQQRETDLNEAREQLEETAKEKEALRKRVSGLEERAKMVGPTGKGNKGSVVLPCLQGEEVLVPMMRLAEKKKIKKLDESTNAEEEEDEEAEKMVAVVGAEFTSVGVKKF